jgi:hypothetical protein
VSEVLVVLLLLHVLGDFFLQRQQDIENRFIRVKTFFLHLAIYVIIGLISIAFFLFNADFMILIGLYYLIHFSIDGLVLGVKKLSKATDQTIYALDQGLHLVAIFMLVFMIDVYGFVEPSFVTYLEPSVWSVLKLITGFLYLLKPTNYTFKTYFLKYKPDETQKDISNAGAHIGSIERLVMLILMIMSAEIALGIVLTAKTLTRYDKLSTDKPFAEYYLLGTLFSILVSLLVYGLIFGWPSTPISL